MFAADCRSGRFCQRISAYSSVLVYKLPDWSSHDKLCQTYVTPKISATYGLSMIGRLMAQIQPPERRLADVISVARLSGVNPSVPPV